MQHYYSSFIAIASPAMCPVPMGFAPTPTMPMQQVYQYTCHAKHMLTIDHGHQVYGMSSCSGISAPACATYMTIPPPPQISCRSLMPPLAHQSVILHKVRSSQHACARRPEESAKSSKVTKSTSPKPIVILTSVKEVAIPKEAKRRCVRASLRAQVEQQLVEQRAIEEKKNQRDQAKYCALDAEMVGAGPDGRTSVLARISIVDFMGNVLLDSLVKPEVEVTDYRSFVTGIHKGDLDNAPSFAEIRIRVIDLIKDMVVIGHALENDFNVLGLAHPAEMLRDTAYVKILRAKLNRPAYLMPSLKGLVSTCLPDFSFRKGNEHNPIEDARAPLELFKKYRKEFEAQIAGGFWTCSPVFYEAH